MYGHDAARTFATSCPQAPNAANVGSLVPRWYVHANDVVTASPSIVGGVVYVGAWDGTFYALDLKTGGQHWQTLLGPDRIDAFADRHTGAYGVITSSAAIADLAGRRTVFVGGGGSMYALDGTSGRVLWRFDVDPKHPTSHGEIESSPVVWMEAPGGPLVIFGADANQDSGFVGEGVWAVRALTGELAWHFNSETLTNHALYGCGNVWSSPALSVDPANPARAAVYFGTADCPNNGANNCPADGSDPHCPAGQHYDYTKRWQPYAEGIVAISASNGAPLWSYQPHAVNSTSDDDFGSSAQLFALPDGRPVVGEGNKDGAYYVVDRTSGQLVWKHPEQGNGNVRSGLAIGGFLGPTAVLPVNGAPMVFGGSAINTPFGYDSATGRTLLQPDPLLGLQPMQAFSGTDGRHAWSAVQGFTYGGTSAANGVVYVGGIDTILRAYDAATGQLRWLFPLAAPISSTPAIAAGAVVVGAGTSYTDLNFKVCDELQEPLQTLCKSTPLKKINPLSYVNGIWAFGLPSS
jgi:outer membrane protein assembly factor BamB